MKLLIAEDERDLAEALTVFFEKNNYTVETVNNGRDAYDYASTGEFDGIILDIMMPVMDGIEVLKKLREDGISVPIMMLTAKTQKDDRILGYDSGADDYLPKPFSPDELLSRVRALLRRSCEYKPSALTYNDLSLDCMSGIITCGDKSLRLVGKEFQLIELFMRTPDIVMSADRIMERIWGWNSDSEINVVWVHISNLRKKLNSIESKVGIHAKRGLGYVLEVSDD